MLFNKNQKISRCCIKIKNKVFHRLSLNGKYAYVELCPSIEQFIALAKTIQNSCPNKAHSVKDNIIEIGTKIELAIFLTSQYLRLFESAIYLNYKNSNPAIQALCSYQLNSCEKKLMDVLSTYSHLSPLWFKGSYKGLKYNGANPYTYRDYLFDHPQTLANEKADGLLCSNAIKYDLTRGILFGKEPTFSISDLATIAMSKRTAEILEQYYQTNICGIEK